MYLEGDTCFDEFHQDQVLFNLIKKKINFLLKSF